MEEVCIWSRIRLSNLERRGESDRIRSCWLLVPVLFQSKEGVYCLCKNLMHHRSTCTSPVTLLILSCCLMNRRVCVRASIRHIRRQSACCKHGEVPDSRGSSSRDGGRRKTVRRWKQAGTCFAQYWLIDCCLSLSTSISAVCNADMRFLSFRFWLLLSLQLSLGSPSYLILTLFSFPPNMNQHRTTFWLHKSSTIFEESDKPEHVAVSSKGGACRLRKSFLDPASRFFFMCKVLYLLRHADPLIVFGTEERTEKKKHDLLGRETWYQKAYLCSWSGINADSCDAEGIANRTTAAATESTRDKARCLL